MSGTEVGALVEVDVDAMSVGVSCSSVAVGQSS
jgi:hypothetical protein